MAQKIKRQSLLYRSKVEYADFSINHALGCAHGCKYPCYAMQMAKRFGRVKDYEDWKKPRIVDNAIDILEGELAKLKNQPKEEQPKFVHLCFTTDPFMYGYPEVGKLSLRILEKLKEYKVPASVLTKGIYPPVLGNTNRFNKENYYGITLVSMDESFREAFEPGASPYQERLEALRELHRRGLRTWVSMEPYPMPNMVIQDLVKILKQISFAETIIFGRLNYGPTPNRDYTYFYERCTRTVIDFCDDHGIEWHIKAGTPGAPQDNGPAPYQGKEKKG